MGTDLQKAKRDFLDAWEIFQITGEINDAREFLRCLGRYDELLKEQEFDEEKE